MSRFLVFATSVVLAMALILSTQMRPSFAASDRADIILPCDPETAHWLEICQPGWKSKLPEPLHDDVPWARSGNPQALAKLAKFYVYKRSDPSQAQVLMALAASQAVLRSSLPHGAFAVSWDILDISEYLKERGRNDFGPVSSLFFDLLSHACRHEHARACYDVAEIYRAGDYGVPKDMEAAALNYWYAVRYVRSVKNHFLITGEEDKRIDGLNANSAAGKERRATMHLGRLCQSVRFKEDMEVICDFSRDFLADIVDEYGKESRRGRRALKLLSAEWVNMSP